jgi:hypothetical protein
MNIQGHVMKFQQKCISKLPRNDAEYFHSQILLKDLAIFSLLLQISDGQLKGEFEANMLIVRYLQIEMHLASLSDDIRDFEFVSKYGLVPFVCEEIIKTQKAIRDTDGMHRSFNNLLKNYPIDSYCSLAGEETSRLVSVVPEKHRSMLDRILEYYSTPIVGACAVMGIKPREFHFAKELKKLLSVVLKKHFEDVKIEDPKVREYIEVMKLIRQTSL